MNSITYCSFFNNYFQLSILETGINGIIESYIIELTSMTSYFEDQIIQWLSLTMKTGEYETVRVAIMGLRKYRLMREKRIWKAWKLKTEERQFKIETSGEL